MWLEARLPERLKPDKVHCYARQIGTEYAQIKIDPAFPEDADKVIDAVTSLGLHALVSLGHTLRFVGAKNKPSPQKIVLNWTL
jgi:hypothetical protein